MPDVHVLVRRGCRFACTGEDGVVGSIAVDGYFAVGVGGVVVLPAGEGPSLIRHGVQLGSNAVLIAAHTIHISSRAGLRKGVDSGEVRGGGGKSGGVVGVARDDEFDSRIRPHHSTAVVVVCPLREGIGEARRTHRVRLCGDTNALTHFANVIIVIGACAVAYLVKTCHRYFQRAGLKRRHIDGTDGKGVIHISVC